MADDNDNRVIDLWQQQTSEGFQLTSEEIQMNLKTLEAKVRARNRGVYLVCAFLIVWFGTWAFVEHDLLMRIGAAAIIIAVVFLAVQVQRNRFAVAAEPQVALPSLEHLRNELKRQRDFHRGKQFWSRMSLLAPAGLLFFFAFARAHPEVIVTIRYEIVAFVLLTIAAVPVNLRMAKKYQRQIDDVDRQKELA